LILTSATDRAAVPLLTKGYVATRQGTQDPSSATNELQDSGSESVNDDNLASDIAYFDL